MNDRADIEDRRMQKFLFNRMECAGSVGDLGTLLPIAMGMILINGLNPLGLFFAIGLYYVISGLYFKVTVPIQPMKVIGAYAIATGMAASQIFASGLLIGIFLFLLGATGAITTIGKYTPKSVVRGVQLSTGTLLMVQGVKFIVGSSKYQLLRQAVEPYLQIQHLGPIPIGWIIGAVAGIVTLLLIENRKLPAGLLVVCSGLAIGCLLGTYEGMSSVRLDIHLPKILPFDFPSGPDFTTAIFILVLPQIPMTLGNAVIAYSDLSKDYFGDASEKVTYRSACISMAFANFISFLLGGMPLCHGAGGLAAHYRFGARTAGSNLIIGAVFILLAVLFGSHILSLVYLLPMSILGVLLLFAGSQLALTLLDIKARKDLFVVMVMLGITLASNLAVGFVVGFGIAYLLKSSKTAV